MFQNLGSFFTASLSEESQRDGDLEEAEEPVVDLEQGDFRFLPEQDEEQTTSSWGDAFPAGQDETERLPLQWGRQQEDQENFVPSGDGELDTELLLEQGLYHDDYDDEQLQYGFGFWEAGDEDDSSFIPHTSAERGTSAPVGNSTTTLFGGMLAHRHHEGEAAGVDEKDPAANLSAGADEDNSEALARALAEVNRSELDDAVLVLGAEVDADPGADGAAGGAAAAVAAGSMYGGYGMGMPMRGPSMKGMPFGSMGGRGSMALGRGSMLMGSKGGYGSMAGSKTCGAAWV
ncbi:unnamed protein product [Amoebophrya sp. A120]|nr:unnamed protein product [Amoebophrya sp. A120]|eukprot:GSA120T00001963001.1